MLELLSEKQWNHSGIFISNNWNHYDLACYACNIVKGVGLVVPEDSLELWLWACKMYEHHSPRHSEFGLHHCQSQQQMELQAAQEAVISLKNML